MKNKPLVILLDSNNTLYRMFHTQPPRTNAGLRTESASSTINSVKRLQNGEKSLDKPEKIIAVFDANGPTFRHELSADYKSERKGMPAELKEQEPLAIDAIRALGIPVLVKDGVEADDTLGMLAEHYVALGYRVIIETVDKDMHQLVTNDINLYNPQTEKIIDFAGVDKKFGVTPDKVAQVLAIAGDKEDGIIGLDKVGIGTASKWINLYGSLQGVIENASEVKGKAGERLRAFSDRVQSNMALTVIRKDPSLLDASDLQEIERTEPDVNQCNAMANKYRFNLTIKSTKSTTAPVKTATKVTAKAKAPVVEVDDDPSQGMLF